MNNTNLSNEEHICIHLSTGRPYTRDNNDLIFFISLILNVKKYGYIDVGDG